MNQGEVQQRERLSAIFRDMSTQELTRRVSQRKITPLAHELATLELQNRLQQPVQAPTTGSTFLDDPRNALFACSMAALVALAFVWLVFEPSMAFMATLVALPIIVAPFAKQFPRIGLALGIVVAALPVALVLEAWRKGDLSFQGGDYKPLGALVAWVVLFFVVVFCWSVAALLIQSALHRGSWADFERKLDQISANQSDTLK
jgi:hypothetical protein